MQVWLLVDQCDEEGWVMARNSAGRTGLVPASFVTQLVNMFVFY